MKMHGKVLVVCIGMMMVSSISHAQPLFMEQYPVTMDTARLKRVAYSQLGSYIAGVSFLSFVWYKDSKRVPFHYYDDSKGYLQVDKAGHAFTAYRESYAAYHALRSSGLNKKKSLWFGGTAGLLFQTPIEVFDGLYEHWGFSWTDMIANAFGSVLFISQEALFDEQLVLMKFSYSPSIYPDYHSKLGEHAVDQFFLDYNAHTYWLSMGLQQASGIEAIPQWLNFAVGYGGNGMIGEFENPTWYNGAPFPYLQRYRQVLFSFDVNFAKIKTNSRFLKRVFRTINLIKIPFPTLELNQKEGLRFRPMYF